MNGEAIYRPGTAVQYWWSRMLCEYAALGTGSQQHSEDSIDWATLLSECERRDADVDDDKRKIPQPAIRKQEYLGSPGRERDSEPIWGRNDQFCTIPRLRL
ncbi:hypothetical protein TWF594_009261 [Orbilia oligospora]|nr:hypothetical protein TWF103_005724 [Orbilia oligospora]KAF3133312.1 hypothetical protein TWF594_009261 [Orbilia oligospora]